MFNPPPAHGNTDSPDDIESCVEKLSNDQFADKPFVFDNEDLHG